MPHQSRASLSSFDAIRARQAYRQRQYDALTPHTTLIRPLSVDANELHYVQPLLLNQHHSGPRSRRAASTIGIFQWTSSFVVKDDNEQRALIRYPDQFPVCSMHLAAMRIQRWWRSLSSTVRTKRSDRRVLANPQWIHPYHRWIDYVDQATSNVRHRHGNALVLSSTQSMLIFFNECATTIQREYRAYRYRKHARFERRLLYHQAASSIQRAWRFHIGRRVSRQRHFIGCVVSIQRAWRSFSDRRVYRYFSSLIRAREASNPHQVLQAVGELDEASGLYIRFRLGGAQFPPLIYYKVFTKQTITDIGAFAPRNYALDECRKRERVKAIKAHSSKSDGKCVAHGTDVSAWYRRYENNGWRLMSMLQLNTSMRQQSDDEITMQTSNTRTWHHPNKLVRASEALRKRKDKEIAWKKKLYGLTCTNLPCQEEKECAIKLPKICARDAPSYDLNDTGDVDDLLDWCVSLSFDEYADVWSNIGTTTHSQPHRVALKLPLVNR